MMGSRRAGVSAWMWVGGVCSALCVALAAGAAAPISEQAKLVAGDAANGDYFGTSVALSGDTAVVGASGKNSSQGAVYVFARTGTAWAQQTKLVAGDAASGDDFGYSVALSGDTAVVGASFKNSSQGAAYVFARTGTAWTQQTKLVAGDAANSDYFGTSVALSGDTAVVGAFGKNSSQGAAYVFTGIGFAGVSSATPARLSAGTSIDVAGAGFTTKPKAWLDLSGRKIALKVSAGATDTQFTAVLSAVPKLTSGACTLNVLPKGAKTPFTFPGQSIQLPVVGPVSPVSAPVGAPVTITGAFFGAKSGRVTLAAKPCTVLAWHDTWIEVLVPAGLTPGAVDVVVDNGVASVSSAGALTITQ